MYSYGIRALAAQAHQDDLRRAAEAARVARTVRRRPGMLARLFGSAWRPEPARPATVVEPRISWSRRPAA
jgi:hypothetical protein